MTDITVIGAGYVGLVTSVCLAELGHRLTVIEIDPAKVSSLRENIMPIYESGLEERWRRYSQSGHLKVTSDYKEGLADARIVFVAVGTPSKENGETDTRCVMEAVKGVALNSPVTPILVIKSTVPVGTGRSVGRILSGYAGSGSWPVVSNPEFLREGQAISDFLEPDRVVLGSDDEVALRTVAELYEPLGKPMVLTDNSTAELIKYASNAFLATKISFINEMSQLSEQLGINIERVAEGIGLDRRIGKPFLEAGIGWGGSCFPKDNWSLLRLMERNNLPASLLRSATEVNTGQIDWVVQRLSRLIVPLRGSNVAVWGLTFKPGTGDTRNSPSLRLIEALLEAGCNIRAFDPKIASLPGSLGASITVCQNPYSAVEGADVLVLATAWPEFHNVDLQRVRWEMRTPFIFDGRNYLDPQEIAALGFNYVGIARGTPQPAEPVALPVSSGGNLATELPALTRQEPLPQLL